jgi:hypothetical protein
MKSFFAIAILTLGLMPASAGYAGSWHATDDGAVRADAFDFVKGRVDTMTAYKQKGVCAAATHGLSTSALHGADDAIVVPASVMSGKAYYYYKVAASVAFFKDGHIGFDLSVYDSPAFYREPRLTPDRSQLADIIGNLSIGDQLKLTKVLKDQNNADKEFRVSELVEAVEEVFGRQPLSFEQRLIDQFLDADQKQFMFCVPERATLRELPYGADDEKNVRSGLIAAEHTMRELVQ